MLNKNINSPQDSHASGVAFAFGAFILWGLVPIFFKALSHVPALEFLGYRMIWSFIFLIILLFFRRPVKLLMPEIFRMISDGKLVLMLFISAILISSNWLVYIWAVTNSRVLETSLGYFINPLMNVALGMFILGERLNRLKLLAVALAAAGVMYMMIIGGKIPWISLYLAASFALYGLVRKKAVVGAILGLWLEILMMLPFAIVYLIYLDMAVRLDGAGHDNYTLFMLMLSGAVTTIPLLLFALAARRLPLSMIGLIQYIAPTIAFFLSVFLWKEPFTTTHMVGFSFIWGGLIIYSGDSYFAKKDVVHEPVIKG